MGKPEEDTRTNKVEEGGSSHSQQSIVEDDDMLNFDIDEAGLLTLKADSHLRPTNWVYKKKIYHTILYGIVTFCCQLGSTSLSSIRFSALMEEQFNISREVTLLTGTLYILGIAFGPMCFAPISEVYGRKIGVLVPFIIAGVFTLSTAVCYNVPSLMVLRFLSGFFSGAPIVSAGGVLSDMFSDPSERGQFLAFYALFVSLGPSCGPTISSLLMYSRPNDDIAAWRIPLYFSGLLILVTYIICELTLSETYVPTIMSRHARAMRLSTRNFSIHSPQDTWKLEAKDVVRLHLVRPFAMLCTPIVFVIVLYASYVFGVFYLIINGVPGSMESVRGWSGTVATLPNMAYFMGTWTGCFVNILFAKRYGRKIKENGGVVIPEERFPLMMWLGWLMPAGIFIFAWTNREDIHWIVPCIGIAFMGCGFLILFQGCLNYLVDTYVKYAASAIAANTFLRSIFASSFPLFVKQLFENLGVGWGASVIGFIALGMLPIPFVFYKYGASIRAKRPYKGI
uniref:MFS transporter n=1 Tax=Cyberlindnera americana TaxID=36016 RepID=A0A5P8N8P3_9ASCO|nr:MFS transporter [Cyberlindnera americana]